MTECSENAPRRALVTGAASGIGWALVHRLLAEGLRVAAIDRARIPFAHPNLEAIQADITEAEQVADCFSQVNERFGGLDILVSNAGMGIHERLDEGDPAKWQRVIETNLMGAMRVVRAFVPILEPTYGADAVQSAGEQESEQTSSARAQPRKDIIIVSSVADRSPHPYGGAYVASKAALSSMAETLRLELLGRIRVACVRPGLVQTSFFDNSVGQSSPTPNDIGCSALQPEEVAEAICFVLSRPSGVVINELTIRPIDQAF